MELNFYQTIPESCRLKINFDFKIEEFVLREEPLFVSGKRSGLLAGVILMVILFLSVIIAASMTMYRYVTYTISFSFKTFHLKHRKFIELT